MRAVAGPCLCAAALAAFFTPTTVLAASVGAPSLLGIPIEFVLFAATLVGVALWQHYTLQVAAAGLAAIAVTGFHAGPGIGFDVGNPSG